MLTPIKQTKEEIFQRRKEIEQELLELVQQTGSDFGFDDVKQIIYDEEDQDDLMKIVAMFDLGGDASGLENILELANDAWNYFPHKALNGLSPAEMALEYQQKQK
ncbi:MAG: hypothetical protein A2660_02005 [Candidatus Doudnabacteria bacterium RIFCSPHIGHO2_01_FULL_45_18]|uniref:Uncharacterized protein n=1 Tax=Candidatus Doudnabacteria bacterium RIFCSPHIGHO2_01_FULL_45_18 TaxID=1817823 RepID=A0A1F5NQD8_9BACT|nr:MAG: hypothetical protein A2660_02005 [Candidatus Doudnabacteria bacterium RIFCSPHIGHO2_01_FULL_45_18]